MLHHVVADCGFVGTSSYQALWHTKLPTVLNYTPWYAAQDRVEMAELGLPAAETMASLQAQINAVLAQLAATTRQIQELTEENKALRREIAVVRQQLVQRAVL
jgi:hypothetical protein